MSIKIVDTYIAIHKIMHSFALKFEDLCTGRRQV